jgi:hypothetical protein
LTAASIARREPSIAISSPFPEIDSFILDLIRSDGGGGGHVRKCAWRAAEGALEYEIGGTYR